MIKSDFVNLLKPYVDFIPVCPEVEMGLTVPRNSIRIKIDKEQYALIDSMTGEDHTSKMDSFTNNYKWPEQLDGAILKNRSPSCGKGDVKTYKSHGRVVATDKKTTGFFAQALENHYPGLPVEDEGRLRNYAIRHHFLTRIFTLARFNPKSMKDLIDFHASHKYLMMAHNQKLLKALGGIVANHEHLSYDIIKEKYYVMLNDLFSDPISPGKNEKVILHMFGYVSDAVSKEEKDYFLGELSAYRNHKRPFMAIMRLLYSWVVRFDVTYLKHQVVFKPYPEDILNLSDSGKEHH
jgi:uncharacterized protein YbgA (DUF1722 family)/uncharacterized protein YbbK (DUF523 family)